MTRPSLALLAILALPLAGAAHAQRADENAVRSAEDAFGATIGHDSIGIYSPDDVRGFSAVVAGNTRIDGLYFDQQQAPTSHLIEAATMRVGIAAQGFAFPAPTGIVDYQLRRPDGSRALSLIARGTGWGGYSLEADGQMPVSDTLALAAGGGYYRDVYADGTWARYAQGSLIARWRPAPGVEITPFVEYAPVIANPAQLVYLTADGAAPVNLPHHYNGPRWDIYRGANLNAGAIAQIELGKDTTLRAGAFRSSGTSRSTFAHLLFDLTPDGTAERIIIADPPRRYTSNSGELRLSHGFVEGPRRHLLIASVRGRAVESRYGGSDAVDFGRTSIFAAGPRDEPTFSFGPRTRDSVRQWSAGVTYSLAWQGVLDASAGVLHTDYAKRVTAPGASAARTRDAPLLWNAALALHLARSFLLYGSQTTGLEEAGAAPDIAINRNSLSPAIRTTQRDAGLRWGIGHALTLVAGVFEVRKPYDAVDNADVFRRLGRLTNRGVEVSLSGAVTPELTLVAGALLLDARVSGEAVAQRLIGRRPVGSSSARAQANAEYTPARIANLSLDLGISWRDHVVATSDGAMTLPPRGTVDLGARWKTTVAKAKLVGRLQLTNAFGAGGYVVLGPGAYKRADPRQLILTLAMDL